MRICRPLGLILTVLYFSLIDSYSSPRPSIEEILPKFEQNIHQAMEEWKVPGASVALIKDGKIVFMKGYGVKKLGEKDPVDIHTQFHLASLTKIFTITLVARLVDEGLLDWDDKVTKYLPEFELIDKSVSDSMKIRDLLSHRSGLKGYAGDSLLYLDWSVEKIIKSLKYFPLENKLGEKYEYQNILVGLVGVIIERVTKKDLATVYKEYLFDPLGLKNTTVGYQVPHGHQSLWAKIKNFFMTAVNIAFPHEIKDGKPSPSPFIDSFYTFSTSSGINSSVEDCAKLMIFLIDGGKINGKQLISWKNLSEARKIHVTITDRQGGRQFPQDRIPHLHYGMGWFIHDYQTGDPNIYVDVLSHMGAMRGSRTLAAIIPTERVGIVILSNYGGLRASNFPEGLRNNFFDAYLEVKGNRNWSKEIKDDFQSSRDKFKNNLRHSLLADPQKALSLEVYTGTYQNALYGKVKVVEKDKKLYLQLNDGAEVLMTHWNANRFQVIPSDLSTGLSYDDMMLVSFQVASSKAQYLWITWLQDGTDNSFVRVE